MQVTSIGFLMPTVFSLQNMVYVQLGWSVFFMVLLLLVFESAPPLPPSVENYRVHFLENRKKIWKKYKKVAPATKGRASRAPFAGNFLYFFHIFCNFSKKMDQVVLHS